MLRVFGISLALLAIAVAVYTTIQQIQPAVIFIEWTTVDGEFPATLVALLTSLLLLAPIVTVIFLIGKLSGSKDFMPDLTGQTGLVVMRKKAAYGAIYVNKVLINGELKSSVSNGKSTFIPLTVGPYYLQIRNKKSKGIDVEISKDKITKVEMSYLDAGLKAKLVLDIVN